MPETMIPLAVLALELGADINQLARRLDGSITVDPASGLRVIPASVARATIDEHIAEQDRERERQTRQRAQIAAVANPTHARVRAIAAAQRAAGLQLDNLGMPAAALATITSDDQTRRMDHAGRRTDQLMRGESIGYRFTPTKEN